MTFATLADVLDGAPKITIGPNTKPSAQDAQALIDAVNAHVSSVVAGLGHANITKENAPQSFMILRDIVVQGSIARILKAMYYGVRDPNEVGANDAWREFNGKLKQLTDPEEPFSLPDAPANDQVQKVSSEIESSVLDNPYGGGWGGDCGCVNGRYVNRWGACGEPITRCQTF